MKQLEKKIERLKKDLMTLGPFHIGTLSKQYNVCGKSGCKCKDPENPVKHGPYYYLHYSIKGKQECRFIKHGEVTKAKQWVANHKRLKSIINELIVAYSKIAKERGFKEE